MAGHFALAFQRMKPYYENGLGDQFWIWVWDENGNGMPNVKLYNSWGTLMGETNYDGQAKIPIGYSEERIFDILCVDDQGATSDVSNLVLTRFYPDFSHYGFECGFIYKSGVNNPGTFDLSMNGAWPQENDQNWDEAPYTESLAYHSVDYTDYHSDEMELGNWQTPDSYFGQTFVANGDRIIAAKVWGVRGGVDQLSWKCQIVTFPGLAPVGPVTATPYEWPFTWMVYWDVNDNPVVPGQTYMLKVWRDENIAPLGMNMYRTKQDVYPDGIYYEGTTPFPNKDLWGYIVFMNYRGGEGGYTDSVGLAGYWNLDETGGDTAADSSGNGHDGVRQENAVWADGMVKGGMCLDGTGDYVDLGNSDRLKSALPLTMAAWIKLDQVGNYQAIINTDKKDYDAEHRIYGAQLLVWGTGELSISFGDGQPNISIRLLNGTTALQPDTWYHVAAVIRGPEDMSLYINGQDDGGTIVGTGGDIAYSDGSIEIGCRSGNILFFDGCIDDVALFDVALTPADIYRLYKLSGQAFLPPCGDVLLPPHAKLPGDINRNCIVELNDYFWLAQEWLHTGLPLLADINKNSFHRVDYYDLDLMLSDWLREIEPRFIGHWTLDDGVGNLAQDSSYNENHGHLQGNATWNAGHLGGALTLDGNGDYVDLEDANSLKPDLPLTITAWIKLDRTDIFQTIINIDKKDEDPNHRIYGTQLLVWNTGELSVSFGDGQPDYSSRRLNGTSTLQSGIWYHIAAVIRGPDDISLYINGQDDGGTVVGAGGDIAYADGSSEIGSRSGTALFLQGTIDEIRFYSRALNSSEINSLATP